MCNFHGIVIELDGPHDFCTQTFVASNHRININ